MAVFFLFVNSFVIEKFTALGENGTFYRHLWAIPSIVIVGIAIVDLIRILPKWYLRIPVIAVVVVGVWLVNSHEYIRLRDLPLSLDAKMVSEDVSRISDELKRRQNEKKIFVVTPPEIRDPLWLYNGDFKVYDTGIFSSLTENGYEIFNEEIQDVDKIMSLSCLRGMDYVVVTKYEDTYTHFHERGYEPVVETDSYMLYECSGFFGVKQDINRWGQTIWTQYYGEDGEPIINSYGYSRAVYEYDQNADLILESYLDQKGNPISRKDKGYAKVKKRYVRHIVTSERYYDNTGNLTMSSDGYAGVERIIDKSNHIIKEMFCDNEEKPTYLSTGYAGISYEYDVVGNIITEIYLDENGKERNTAMGYSRVRKQYSKDNQIVKEEYYDINGELVK